MPVLYPFTDFGRIYLYKKLTSRTGDWTVVELLPFHEANTQMLLIFILSKSLTCSIKVAALAYFSTLIFGFYVLKIHVFCFQVIFFAYLIETKASFQMFETMRNIEQTTQVKTQRFWVCLLNLGLQVLVNFDAGFQALGPRGSLSIFWVLGICNWEWCFCGIRNSIYFHEIGIKNGIHCGSLV